MSLIECCDCGRALSSDAIDCLGCGRPNQGFLGQPVRERTWNPWCLGILIAFIVVPVLLVFRSGATEVGGLPAQVRSATVAADPPPAPESPAETDGSTGPAEAPTPGAVVPIPRPSTEPRAAPRAPIAVTLKRGRRLVAQEVVERGDDVVVKLRDGVTLTFPRSSIASIERPGAEPSRE